MFLSHDAPLQNFGVHLLAHSYLDGSSAAGWIWQGFKISVSEKPVTPVTENDCHILQLYWTMEMLQLRLNTLDGRISM